MNKKKQVEQRMESLAEQSYRTARHLGFSKGESMKAYNRYHQTVDRAKKRFKNQYERDHGVKPTREGGDF